LLLILRNGHSAAKMIDAGNSWFETRENALLTMRI
jgi:hypothetical protein